MDMAKVRRRMRLRDLDTLMAVVQTGGMRRAAQQLHLSQPAVSKAVRELEQALGVMLLDRSRRGVEVTPFGRAIVGRTKAMFDELEGALRDIEHLVDPQGGEVHLACMETLQAGLVGAAIASMTREFPRMRFQVEGGQANDLIDYFVRERLVEFATARPYAALPADLHGEPLFRDQLRVVVGSAHPQAQRRKIGLAELAGLRWILSRNEAMPDSPVAQGFAALGLPLPRTLVTTGSLNLRYALLAKEPCVTVMPHSLLPFAQHGKSVRVLPIELPPWDIATMVITLKDRTVGPVAARFLERVRTMSRPLA